MIAEISASLSVIKESLGLLKVISDAKTDTEIQNATNELREKLRSLQMENMALSNLIHSQLAEISSLKSELQKIKSFESEASEYQPYKFTSGTVVYSRAIETDKGAWSLYACPHCFAEQKISILQPSNGDHTFNHVFCPSCKNDYRENKRPPVAPRVIKNNLY